MLHAVLKRIRTLLDAIRSDGHGFFQFMRYGITGLSSTVTFFIVSNGAYLLSRHSVWSSIVGWLFSFIVSIIGHGYFTDKSLYNTSIVAKFFVLAVWNLLLIQIITNLGEFYFGWPYWITSLCIVGVVPFFSFFIGRHLVFEPNTR